MQKVTTSYHGYIVTTDKSLMNVEDIHQWLSGEAYWSMGIPYETVKTLFDNSYCIGVVKDGRQIGFARLVTDYATFARSSGCSEGHPEVLIKLRLRRASLF